MAATMSDRIRESELWRERCGMSHGQCCTLIAILSAYALHGNAVRAADVRAFLDGQGEPGTPNDVVVLAKRGWIRSVNGRPGVRTYEPTDRGWRFLGFEPRRAATAVA